MKNNLSLSFNHWLFMFIMIFAVGCASPTVLQEQASTANVKATPEAPIEMPLVTASAVMTSISTPTTTSTHIPTTTSTPLRSTATVTSSPVLPPIPTLNRVEEAALVQELMATNGGCQLPCWWGIQLGESLKSIGEVFNNVGIGSWHESVSDFGGGGERGYVRSGYYNPDTFGYDVSVTVDFHTVDGVVQFIDVYTERPLRQYGEKVFVRDWEKHFLSSILQKYGKPQYVYFEPLNIADPAPPDHSLGLYYSELGINVSYTFYGIWIGDVEAEVCLALENVRDINLSLYNPELADVWGAYLIPPEFYSDPKLVELFSQWTWEAQTGMDLDTFYETYKNPDNLGCIQVK